MEPSGVNGASLTAYGSQTPRRAAVESNGSGAGDGLRVCKLERFWKIVQGDAAHCGQAIHGVYLGHFGLRVSPTHPHVMAKFGAVVSP